MTDCQLDQPTTSPNWINGGGYHGLTATGDTYDYRSRMDDLAAHNVAKVEIKFKGQMVEQDWDVWRFEPDGKGCFATS